MINKICSKLSKGFLQYGIDETSNQVSLLKDIPARGTKGARFDDTPIAVDKINAILASRNTVKTYDFNDCFSRHTSNNGPMLIAALINEGVLKEQGNHQYLTIKPLEAR